MLQHRVQMYALGAVASAFQNMIAEETNPNHNPHKTMTEINIITVTNKHDRPRQEAWVDAGEALIRARYLAFHAITEGDLLDDGEEPDGSYTFSWDGLAHEESVTLRKLGIFDLGGALLYTEKNMADEWGPRCDQHEPGCPTCEAWALWDTAPGTIPSQEAVESAITDHVEEVFDAAEEEVGS